MAVDYQEKYEVFLREVLKDIEHKTQAAQYRAEENVAGKLPSKNKQSVTDRA